MKVLRVVYTSGRTEDIESADRYKTLVLANVESYEWVGDD